MKKQFFWISIIFVSFLNRGIAQVNTHFTHLGIQDGLEYGGVNCMIQDKQGFIWIGNDECLLRYDGHRFKKFEHNPAKPKESIVSGRVTSLYEDSKGNIWIGSFTGGLSIFDPSTLKFQNYFEGTHQLFYGDALGINCIGAWGKDSILVSTRAGLFLFKDRKIIKKYGKNNAQLSNDFSSSFDFDRQGNLFLGTLSGLNILKKKQQNFISHLQFNDYSSIFNSELRQKNRDGKAVLDLIIDSKNNLWIDYWFPAIYKFNLDNNQLDTLTFTGLEGEKFENLPVDFLEDKSGKMWIATNVGLFEYNLNNGKHYRYQHQANDPNSIQSDHLTCLMLDRNNVLWIGTQNGISKLNLNKPIYSYESDAQKIGLSHIASMAKMQNEIMVFADNEKVKLVNPEWEVIKTHPIKNNIAIGVVWNISTSTYARLYIQRSKGFSILNLTNGKENLFTQFDCFYKSPVMKINEQGDSVIWLSRWWWDKENILKLNVKNEKLTVVNTPIKMNEDRGYAVWGGIDLNDKTIRFISNKGWMDVDRESSKVMHYDSNYVGGKFIYDQNTIYSNTSSEGFYTVDRKTMKKKLYSRVNGLPNKMINGFLKTDSTVWMAYHSGLISFKPASKKIIFFDGLSGNGIKSTQGNILNLDKQNKLLFTDGKTIYGFKKENANNVLNLPKPSITNLLIDNHEIPPINYKVNLELPFRKNNTEISFSSFTYNHLGLVKYRYRLSGLEKEWNYTTENTVTYINLPEGKFHFEFGYTLDGQNWSSSAKELNLFVLSPWYLKWWFYLILVIVLGLIFYLIYKIRLNRILELQGLRNHISRDLHDEVGSTLSSISMLSETLKYTLQKEETEGKKISEQIGQNAQKMLNVMDDIVWAINPKDDSLKNMIIRMREQANENTEFYGISLLFKLQPEKFQDVKITMLARKNIYLIFKEIINNACKHAACTTIKIEINLTATSFNLRIMDDGKGFDFNQESKRNGLRNIKERIRDIKGIVEINSSEGKGTLYNITVPIP